MVVLEQVGLKDSWFEYVVVDMKTRGLRGEIWLHDLCWNGS